jgi:dUTP pyrophosphatase
MLCVRLLSENATLPTRGSAMAAGADLHSAEMTVVPARGMKIVKTDIAIICPEGTYGRVAPRSGLAAKHGIDVGAGVIDSDYRGNVGVILFNHSDNDFVINVGDRIAQLILEQIIIPTIVRCDSLSETARGTGGFGSTGK